MGNHIQFVAHPQFFLDLTLFSIAHITIRIQYVIIMFTVLGYYQYMSATNTQLPGIHSINHTSLM